MEIQGKVIAKPASKTGISQKGPWKKAFLVIRYEEGQYPKDILLSCMKKAEDFERVPIGAVGTFRFDSRVGNKDGNYFQDLECWSWTTGAQQQAYQPAPTQGPI